MPERHRGAQPHDRQSFDDTQRSRLESAVSDLSWLLDRSYSMGASNELVGDHYQLTSRQRLAVARVAGAEEARLHRQAKSLSMTALKGQTVLIDGFNLLITIETALGGGVVFSCKDGCCRDLSSVYGSYKIVEETRAAIETIGKTLEQAQPEKVLWLFDRPVSNSGRVAALVRDIAAEHNWPFAAELTDRTDARLSRSEAVVVSCDSAILDRAARWCNLACEIITGSLPDAWVVDLTGSIP